MPTEIRVLFPKNPPDNFDNCRNFPNFPPNINCLFPGWTLEILMTIAEALQLTVIPVYMDSPGEVNWGTLSNGTWAGALSFLQTNQVDVVSLLYQQTTARRAYFDYSYPVTFVQEVINVRQMDPSGEYSIRDALKPFDNTVWILFLLSCVLQAIMFIFVKHIEDRIEMDRRELKLSQTWETTWNVIAFQLMQYQESFSFFTNTGRFLLTSFGICHLVLFLGLYQSYLISALLQKSTTYPFNSLSEMVQAIDDGRYELLKIPTGAWIYEDVDNSPLFEKLRAVLAKRPYVIAESSDDGLDFLEKGKYAMFNQIDGYAALLVNERCNILTITEGLPQKTAHFLFQRNSSFIESFNKQIIMQQSFILRTYAKYFDAGFKIYQPSSCPDVPGVDEYRPLALMDCIGIFIVLIIGWILSPLAILLELLIHRFLDQPLIAQRSHPE